MRDEPLTLESLYENLRNAHYEKYDPDIHGVEPPYNPQWAKAESELQYILNPRIRTWMDARLVDLAASVKRQREAAEVEPQRRLPFPQACPWMWLQETIDRYAALRALVKLR
jgi:hypothetical protein